MSDGLSLGLPGQDWLDQMKEKGPKIVKSVVEAVIESSNSALDLSPVEFGLSVGLPAFFVGLAIAFLVCSCCIPGKTIMK